MPTNCLTKNDLIMWIILILAFIAGGVIAWLIDEVVEHISDREKYSKLEFKTRIGWRIFGPVWTAIIASALTLIGACIALDNTDKDLKARTEKLEQKVEQLEAVNQIDTIVIHRFIDEEDLF